MWFHLFSLILLLVYLLLVLQLFLFVLHVLGFLSPFFLLFLHFLFLLLLLLLFLLFRCLLLVCWLLLRASISKIIIVITNAIKVIPFALHCIFFSPSLLFFIILSFTNILRQQLIPCPVLSFFQFAKHSEILVDVILGKSIKFT